MPPQVSLSHPADMIQYGSSVGDKRSGGMPQPYASTPPRATSPPSIPAPGVSNTRSLPIRPPAHPTQSGKTFAQTLYASSTSKTLGPMLAKPDITNATQVSNSPQNRQSARLSLLPMAPPLAPSKDTAQFHLAPSGQVNGQIMGLEHHLPHRTQSLQVGGHLPAMSHVHHPGRTSTYFDGQFAGIAGNGLATASQPQTGGSTLGQPTSGLIPQSSANGNPPGYQDPYYSNPMPSPELATPTSGFTASSGSVSPPASSTLFSQSSSPAPSSATTVNSGTLSPLWSPNSGSLNGMLIPAIVCLTSNQMT